MHIVAVKSGTKSIAKVDGHLIPDKQAEAAEMIDDLIVPVAVELSV